MPSPAVARRARARLIVAFGLAVLGTVALTLIGLAPSAAAEPASVLASANGSIKLVATPDAQAILSAAEMKPGSSASGNLTLDNQGDPASVALCRATFVTDPGTHGGRIGDVLQLNLKRLSSATVSSKTLYDGGLRDLDAIRDKPYASGEVRTYRFKVSFPDQGVPASGSSGDNQYQGSRADAGFLWAAVPADGSAPAGQKDSSDEAACLAAAEPDSGDNSGSDGGGESGGSGSGNGASGGELPFTGLALGALLALGLVMLGSGVALRSGALRRREHRQA